MAGMPPGGGMMPGPQQGQPGPGGPQQPPQQQLKMSPELLMALLTHLQSQKAGSPPQDAGQLSQGSMPSMLPQLMQLLQGQMPPQQPGMGPDGQPTQKPNPTAPLMSLLQQLGIHIG